MIENDQGLSDEDRDDVRKLVDKFGAVDAAEFLGLSPPDLCQIILNMPITIDTAKRCRKGMVEVGETFYAVLPLFEDQPAPEAPPLSSEALREMGRGFVRNVFASVVAREARALGNDDGPRSNPFASAAWRDDSDDTSDSQEPV